jgi:hypothetical protein
LIRNTVLSHHRCPSVRAPRSAGSGLRGGSGGQQPITRKSQRFDAAGEFAREFHHSLDDSRTLVFVECWASEEARRDYMRLLAMGAGCGRGLSSMITCRRGTEDGHASALARHLQNRRA